MPLFLLVACRPDPTATDAAPPDSTAPDTAASTVPSTGDTAAPPVATDFALTVDPDVVLLLHATFTDPGADDGWVEYRFEGDDWLTAPLVGPGSATILGIPAETAVEARPAFVVGGRTTHGPSATATTGALPSYVLSPRVVTWDPTEADPAPYGMIELGSGSGVFDSPFVIQIFDRSGRVVWYQRLPTGLMGFYAAPSRDGTHLWFDQEHIFTPSTTSPAVTRETLDGRWSTVVEVDGLGQAVAEGPDDAFFVEHRESGRHALDRVDPSGAVTTVWDCGAWFSDHGLSPGDCLMNACNWDPDRDTVLVSQFETSTVFEIDVATGEPIRQMGELAIGDPYAFDPPGSNFAYQHDPRWTSAGTLMVSTHRPCPPHGSGCDPESGQDGIQVAAEYTVDDQTHTLTRIWSYESTDRWATQWGEAYRRPNGNLIQGYGQDGAVREVAPDGTIAWEAEWPPTASGYRLVGHFSLLDDLYALNRGR